MFVETFSDLCTVVCVETPYLRYAPFNVEVPFAMCTGCTWTAAVPVLDEICAAVQIITGFIFTSALYWLFKICNSCFKCNSTSLHLLFSTYSRRLF